MSGHCKHCGYDGCVCDDEKRINRTVSKLLPHEKAYLKKLNTHAPDKCEGRPCCVHNPSDHHMRSWPMNFRFDKGIMERICPEHGVGHPDPDDADYWLSIDKEYMTIHGCCGCCENKAGNDLQTMSNDR